MPQPKPKTLVLWILLAVLVAVVLLRLDAWRRLIGGEEAGGPDLVPVAVMDAPLPRSDLALPPRVSGAGVLRHDYSFSEDWFTWNVGVWREVLASYAGQPDLRYLEIGLFEGRSALWIAENVLTHETSRLTGIDPFLGEGSEERLYANLETFGEPERFTVIKGFSQQELPKLEPESFDIIYIDGSHTADDVLADAVMSWELLKEGGLVIFDDYGWRTVLPVEQRPMMAIDAFITAYRNRLEVIHRGFQVIARKVPLQGCPSKQDCSRVNDRYVFDWQSGRLFEAATGEPVALDFEEQTLLASLLRSRRFGAGASTYVAEDLEWLRSNPRFESLVERLGFDL